MVSLLKIYWKAFRKTFDFSGTASRKEYWTFSLVNAGIFLLVTIIGMTSVRGFVISMLFFMLFFFIQFIPSISITIRRLYDAGYSALWFLLVFVPVGGIILFFFLIEPTKIEGNKYMKKPVMNKHEGLTK